jgi:hypothetical protein
MKSSSVKLTKCEHVFDAFDPYHLSFVLASDYFRPRFRALGWWNVRYICFRFGRPRTAVPERANRSDEKSLFPSFPLRYCWSFSLLLVRIGFGVSSDNFEFWPSSRLYSRSGFLWLLMLHCSVQTRIAKTPTFSSLYINYFGYLCCVYTNRFRNSACSADFVVWVRTNDNSNVGSVLTLSSQCLFCCWSASAHTDDFLDMDSSVLVGPTIFVIPWLDCPGVYYDHGRS